MPIEVKELIIRTTVTEDDNKSANSTTGIPVNTDIIISECVEQVLRILKDKNER